MRLIWDKPEERFYETGIEKGVLYPQTSGTYPLGVVWNGITSVSENPSGAEPSAFYADNIKYFNLMSTEEFGLTLGAYFYPDEFAECNGEVSVIEGLVAQQQSRKLFGLSYVTKLGNSTEMNDYGYKIHLVYGALAAPSGKEYTSVNDSPEPNELSWEITTTPVESDIMVNNKKIKPTASLVIDSTKCDSAKLKALEDILYGKDAPEGGGDATVARLPLPSEVATILGLAQG